MTYRGLAPGARIAGHVKVVGFAIGIALSVVPCAAQMPMPRMPMRLSANPSAVVAAEIAFARLAQERGQWTAFRKTAAKDAVMFVPQMVTAHTWLKSRKDPPVSVKWQPQMVVMSCDGSIGVTTGAAQWPNGAHGYFTTVWRRDRKGGWQWVLDHGDIVATPRPPADIITTRLATCPRGMPPMPPPGKPVLPPPPAALATPGQGMSEDGSLKWTSDVRPDRSRRIVISLMTNGVYEDVLVNEVAGQP